jgi:8-oxo-dGTP pyrophosphatase MutT (NUDIX family)
MSRHRGVAPEQDAAPSVEWAGAILVNGHGELLLNLRDESKALFSGLWDLIGGTLQAGETPEACMLREVREETGETLHSVRYLRTFDVPLDDAIFGRLYLFRGEIDRRATELLLGEGREHRFFAPAGLAGIDIVPGTREMLEAYVAGEFGAADPFGDTDARPHPNPLPGGEGIALRSARSPSPAASSPLLQVSTSPSPRRERGTGGEVHPPSRP